MKPRLAAILFVIIVPCMAIAFGMRQFVTSKRRLTSGIGDPVAMKALLCKAIPPGTSVKNAQAFMEHEGFQCSEQKSQLWGETNRLQNYVYCDRSDAGTFDHLVQRRWQIALIEEDGRIRSIEAHTGLIGP